MEYGILLGRLGSWARHFFLCAGLIILGAILTGCGGGDGGDGGGGQNNNGSLAPSSVQGYEVTLSETGGSSQRLVFAASGSNFTAFAPGTTNAIRSGTYTYSAANNSAALTLLAAGGGQPTVYTLQFSSSSAGSFTYPGSGGQTISGSFSELKTATSGGGNGGQSGTGGLDGRVIVMTRSTGQSHTFTYTGNRFTDSDPPEEGSGTYSYSRTGQQATLTMHYTSSSGPVNLVGDRQDVQLTYASDTRGSFTSAYAAADGTMLTLTGSFEVVR